MAKVRCPCGRLYAISDEHVGKRVKCRACGESFVARVEASPPPKPPPAHKAAPTQRATREHPISEAQRDSLRRTVEAAARRQADKKKAATRALRVPGPVKRLRWRHVAAAAAVAAAVLVAIRLRPAPASQRTLVTYLESCSEDATGPRKDLALRDFSLDVRSFGAITLQAATCHDFAPELKVFAERNDGTTWADLLRSVKMPCDKRQALSLAAPAFPESLAPNGLRGLRITVQPAALSMLSKPRGIGTFRESRFRFLLLKVESPRWESGWKVAACERVPGAAAG